MEAMCCVGDKKSLEVAEGGLRKDGLVEQIGDYEGI